MSDEVEQAMNRVLGHPSTCPHGNPIPGTKGNVGALVRLGEIAAGDTFTVKRIPEELEFTPGMLDFLETNGLVPGSSGRVIDQTKDGGRVITVQDRDVTVDPYAVARIFVEA
jgi:DtxR family Mn-dependent transcriptional regulator